MIAQLLRLPTKRHTVNRWEARPFNVGDEKARWTSSYDRNLHAGLANCGQVLG